MKTYTIFNLDSIVSSRLFLIDVTEGWGSQFDQYIIFVVVYMLNHNCLLDAPISVTFKKFCRATSFDGT